jgi:hypothetical protein
VHRSRVEHVAADECDRERLSAAVLPDIDDQCIGIGDLGHQHPDRSADQNVPRMSSALARPSSEA